MSQDEVDKLKAQVAKLTDLVQQADIGKAATAQNPRYVYSAKKLRKYAGDTADLEDWLLEARNYLATTGYEGKDASDFLLTHLEGAARKEIRMLSSEDKKDPEKILSLTEKQFGERLKSSQIINEFHKRDQKRTESLREYSHALLELTDRAI